jgi:5'-3' exoribonuclease 2
VCAGVFPAGSRQHIPVAWQDLLINVESPIIDFYPEDFVVDLNGKKYEWQGVALLPFVEENRLLEALKVLFCCLCVLWYLFSLHGMDLFMLDAGLLRSTDRRRART